MLHSLTSSLQVGNSNGLVQVLNMSTGHYPKGGTSKVAGQVTALNFDSSGKTLWAGDDKVEILSLLGNSVGENIVVYSKETMLLVTTYWMYFYLCTFGDILY